MIDISDPCLLQPAFYFVPPSMRCLAEHNVLALMVRLGKFGFFIWNFSVAVHRNLYPLVVIGSPFLCCTVYTSALPLCSNEQQKLK